MTEVEDKAAFVGEIMAAALKTNTIGCLDNNQDVSRRCAEGWLLSNGCVLKDDNRIVTLEGNQHIADFEKCVLDKIQGMVVHLRLLKPIKRVFAIYEVNKA